MAKHEWIGVGAQCGEACLLAARSSGRLIGVREDMASANAGTPKDPGRFPWHPILPLFQSKIHSVNFHVRHRSRTRPIVRMDEVKSYSAALSQEWANGYVWQQRLESNALPQSKT